MNLNIQGLNLTTLGTAAQGTEFSSGVISLFEVTDPEAFRLLVSKGFKPNRLGLFSTKQAEAIATFGDLFSNNAKLRYLDIRPFVNLTDIDLRGTYASISFGSEDPDETVPQSEIDAWLSTLQ